MRRLGTIIGAGALLVLAAGCAGGQTGTTTPGAQPTLSTAPASPSTHVGTPAGGGPAMGGTRLPAGSTPVAGTQVNATGLPPAYPRLVWLEGDGSTLGFYGQQGGCDTLSASVPAQTDSQVTIRLVQQKPASTRPCPMYLTNKPMTVKLAKPLGTRQVVLQQVIERG